MTRVLITAHASVGHTNALRAIGRHLIERGHAAAMAMQVVHAPDVPFVPEAARAAASIPAAVRAEGIELFPLPSSWSALWHGLRVSSATGYDELEHALAMFTAGMAAQGRAVWEAARSWRADVVVSDYLHFSGWLGAALARLPFVAFYHSALPFPTTGRPPFGSGLPDDAPADDSWRAAEQRLAQLQALVHRRLASAAQRLGLAPPPAGMLSSPYSTDLNLLATLPELEPGLAPLAGPVVFTGPCVSGRPQHDPADPALQAVRGGQTNLYVSLGTVFNDQPEVFRHILQGLELEGTHVIVSAGASAGALQADPPSKNASVFRRVPQVALLELVDVVVTHGGNNTTQETLAAGKPMLVIPFGGDQLENARRIERLGVGIALFPRQLAAQSVRAAATRLLSDGGFTARAAALGASVRRFDGTARAAEEIVGVASRGRG